MSKLPRGLVGVIATGAVFAALAEAGAETCTLKLKRLQPLDRAQADSGEVPDYLYWDTNFLSFYIKYCHTSVKCITICIICPINTHVYVIIVIIR